MEKIDRFAVILTETEYDDEKTYRIVDRQYSKSIVKITCPKFNTSEELANRLLPIVDEFVREYEEEND